jgi:hypothetical protein
VQHSVTIQAEPEPGATPRQIQLQSGESAVFGACGCGACGMDLVVGAGGAWLAGEVTATESHWLLSNLVRDRSLLVENLENRFEYLTVTPGRCRAPVSFELARICASDDPDGPALTVFAPEPVQIVDRPPPCPAAAPFRPPLDPNATYFAVLEALCRPRLDGSPDEPLPTSYEIAVALRARQMKLTGRAVDAHIEYVGEKLGLGRGARRDVLVATAVRRGLVQTA